MVYLITQTTSRAVKDLKKKIEKASFTIESTKLSNMQDFMELVARKPGREGLSIKYILTSVIETLLRVFPFPCKTGLTRIGKPDRNSPVFLTCNYHLTVERVKRELRGIDCYLLVANSRGYNVWCGAAGGHFTSHDVVSSLKTSGVEEGVAHREVVLPQLAATGVEAGIVQEKTGWKIIWGPVYAEDIPVFIENSFRKASDMREVRFSPTQRVEMAAMWAFPLSILAALVALPLWRDVLPSLIAMVWLWGSISFIFVLILSMDLMGSTPVYKSGLHDDRLLKVALDKELYEGAGLCEEVCPRNCFEVNRTRRKATMPRAERCVQCGACIVQCPLGALHFESPSGEKIPPEAVRKFKLNLIGKRRVKV